MSSAYRVTISKRAGINAADASDGTLFAYAKAHKLKVRELYQWKTALGRRGLLQAKRALVQHSLPSLV